MHIKEITKARFDILAGYTRQPGSFLFGEEREYLSSKDDRVLGVLLRDTSDGNFAGIVIGPVENGQYRAVEVRPFSDSEEVARADLVEGIEAWSCRPISDFRQGGPLLEHLDAFLPCASTDKLNPSFVSLSSSPAFIAARRVIERMMPYFTDVDGNFIKDFQTTGFDARIWELYLFAAFTEQGCTFDRSVCAPDYACDFFGESFFVEATTVNPTIKNGIIYEPDMFHMDKAELKEYLLNYMPVKWGSALFSKLQKKYWELPHIGKRPIIFAIQDFHMSKAMAVSGSTLAPYLYGLDFSAFYTLDGDLEVTSSERKEHTWNGKTIPSGFFKQPGAEHISAVISNPLGTIAKFNRMGVGASFGQKENVMTMTGTCHNHDPNASLPIPFQLEVKESKWNEPWTGGMNVFHNPFALHPLHPTVFNGVAQHRLSKGQVISNLPDFHPYGAINHTIVPKRRRMKR